MICIISLLFTPVSITLLIDTEDACFDLNASRPIAKGDLKWRDALLVAHHVNSNIISFFNSLHAFNPSSDVVKNSLFFTLLYGT